MHFQLFSCAAKAARPCSPCLLLQELPGYTQVNVWRAENLYTHVEADNEVGCEVQGSKQLLAASYFYIESALVQLRKCDTLTSFSLIPDLSIAVSCGMTHVALT